MTELGTVAGLTGEPHPSSFPHSGQQGPSLTPGCAIYSTYFAVKGIQRRFHRIIHGRACGSNFVCFSDCSLFCVCFVQVQSPDTRTWGIYGFLQKTPIGRRDRSYCRPHRLRSFLFSPVCPFSYQCPHKLTSLNKAGLFAVC